MDYPTTFTDNPKKLSHVALDNAGIEAVNRLRGEGFEIVAGVQVADVQAIAEIAQQKAVLEFCPNDVAKRFGDQLMMERWLGKNGGRGVFLLREIDTQLIRGYGWAGRSKCEQLPDYLHTFGVRLDKQVGGRGLGTPFVAAIFSGSKALYETRGIWGETWGSNAGAVKTYLRAGAVLVATTDDWRPTLGMEQGDAYGKRRDIRLLLKFPKTLS